MLLASSRGSSLLNVYLDFQVRSITVYVIYYESTSYLIDPFSAFIIIYIYYSYWASKSYMFCLHGCTNNLTIVGEIF